jgi:hypothetical protein
MLLEIKTGGSRDTERHRQIFTTSLEKSPCLDYLWSDN